MRGVISRRRNEGVSDVRAGSCCGVPAPHVATCTGPPSRPLFRRFSLDSSYKLHVHQFALVALHPRANPDHKAKAEVVQLKRARDWLDGTAHGSRPMKDAQIPARPTGVNFRCCDHTDSEYHCCRRAAADSQGCGRAAGPLFFSRSMTVPPPALLSAARRFPGISTSCWTRSTSCGCPISPCRPPVRSPSRRAAKVPASARRRQGLSFHLPHRVPDQPRGHSGTTPARQSRSAQNEDQTGRFSRSGARRSGPRPSGRLGTGRGIGQSGSRAASHAVPTSTGAGSSVRPAPPTQKPGGHGYFLFPLSRASSPPLQPTSA